jgi:acyl-[acyl-carrier-protein]-phospholipid O-acyltransferase/long-chain-fatty-acid--[acyl-carrier-protein] ligase
VPLLVHKNLLRASDENNAKEKAVLLFTSGSEGKPKGVVLTHENIQANRFQVAARIDFNSSDKVFNALPMFHSFGLTIGTLLPVLSGMKTFLYPSPLHYRVIPELVYESDSTILFGTDTFLRGYGLAAHPYDFHHTRLVFAGAEPLRPSTRAMWAEKFGIRILEGYGATETAPVLSMLTPMHYKSGSVGKLLPQIEYRIEPISGVEEDGRLFVKGPNVMAGYLRNDQQLDTPPEGWYDTGDIVNIDSDGFLYIRGRAKRFAKVGGEMVSLPRIEEIMAAEWPSKKHAIIAISDEKKGEQLIIFSEHPQLDKNVVAKLLRDKGLPEIALPRRVININVMPILGSGKINYQELSQHLTRGTI